jgi:hypothetical protein
MQHPEVWFDRAVRAIAVAPLAALPPRAAFTAVMACRGRCRATGDACLFHHAGRRSVYSSLLKATAGFGVYTLVVSRNPDTVVGRHWSRGNPTGA